MSSIPRSPPPTYQGIKNTSMAKFLEPNPTPARPVLPSIPSVRIVIRQPDGQDTIMLMYPGSNRE